MPRIFDFSTYVYPFAANDEESPVGVIFYASYEQANISKLSRNLGALPPPPLCRRVRKHRERKRHTVGVFGKSVVNQTKLWEKNEEKEMPHEAMFIMS